MRHRQFARWMGVLVPCVVLGLAFGYQGHGEASFGDSEGEDWEPFGKIEPKEHGMVLPADLVVMDFGVRAPGISEVRAMVDSLRSEVTWRVAPRAVKIRMGQYAMSTEGETQLRFARGTIEVAVDPASEYWARAHIVEQLRAAVSATPAPQKRSTSANGAGFQFGAPKAGLTNAQAHRTALLQREANRFSVITSGGIRRPAVHCLASREVIQRARTLGEVELYLQAECRTPEDPTLVAGGG